MSKKLLTDKTGKQYYVHDEHMDPLTKDFSGFVDVMFEGTILIEKYEGCDADTRITMGDTKWAFDPEETKLLIKELQKAVLHS